MRNIRDIFRFSGLGWFVIFLTVILVLMIVALLTGCKPTPATGPTFEDVHRAEVAIDRTQPHHETIPDPFDTVTVTPAMIDQGYDDLINRIVKVNQELAAIEIYLIREYAIPAIDQRLEDEADATKGGQGE
jgi:PBP1b-binding outer membrane lipoprotein LpoB